MDSAPTRIPTAPAPVLLRDVLPEPERVIGLLAANAPYTPLGGWYRPGADDDAPTSPLWFQQDWLHAGHGIPGVELFTDCPAYHEGACAYYGAEVVVPHSVYVNVMVALAEHGPAHTDNPKFRGRERKDTPMWLLRSMLWSGLFVRWEIPQATAIWWLDDVEEGGLLYWPKGPAAPPERHVGRMANTALLGDNHHMFHQVERVGPFDQGTRRVTRRAELSPVAEPDGEWAVRDRGEEVFRAPLSRYRVSVLWKADVYPSEAERRELEQDRLDLAQVARVFDADLAARGESLRFDLERLEDPAFAAAIGALYPEAVPTRAGRSIYEAEVA